MSKIDHYIAKADGDLLVSKGRKICDQIYQRLTELFGIPQGEKAKGELVTKLDNALNELKSNRNNIRTMVNNFSEDEEISKLGLRGISTATASLAYEISFLMDEDERAPGGFNGRAIVDHLLLKQFKGNKVHVRNAINEIDPGIIGHLIFLFFKIGKI